MNRKQRYIQAGNRLTETQIAYSYWPSDSNRVALLDAQEQEQSAYDDYRDTWGNSDDREEQEYGMLD